MSEAKGGLVGAGGSMVRNLSSVLPSGNRFALWLVFGAGAITVLKKAGVAIPDYAMWFGISLGIAALLYEMTASKDMIRAWWHGRAGSTVASFAIWFCAFAFSVNNWLGAASENQVEKSNLHQSSFVAYQTAQSDLKAKKAELDRVQNRLAWMDAAVNGKPVRTAEAAQSDIDNARANRWWATTEGCTKTKGPQTRAFCDAYRSANAEKSLALEKAQLEEELKTVKADHEEAKAVAANTKAETSEVRGDNVLLVRYGGLAEADAETLQGLIAVMVVSILLSFGSMRSEHEELSKLGPRTPFNWGIKLRRWFSKTLYGREPGDVQVIVERHEAPTADAVKLRRVTLAQLSHEQGLKGVA